MGVMKNLFLGVDTAVDQDVTSIAVGRLLAGGKVHIEALLSSNGLFTRREEILFRILSRVRVEETGYESACWLWTGPDSGSEDRRGGGYPRMSLDGQTVAVHRVLWMHFNGFLPPKKQLDHQCNMRMCINPDHFEKVTQRAHSIRDERHKNFLGNIPFPEEEKEYEQIRFCDVHGGSAADECGRNDNGEGTGGATGETASRSGEGTRSDET